MKFVSWNVNGIRACIKKWFLECFYDVDADFFCIQETKMQEGQFEREIPRYEQLRSSAEKKGYSETAVVIRHQPFSAEKSLEIREKLTILLSEGFIDTYRHYCSDKRDVYRWRSYRDKTRADNTGGRIDYFIVSSFLKETLKGAKIHSDILGREHCPVISNTF